MILHDLLSFELLRVIWWGLLGVLLIGFAIRRARGRDRQRPRPPLRLIRTS